MSGITKRNTGDITYEALEANLTGGQVVIPSTQTPTVPGAQGIKAAGDLALNVLGVVNKDCVTKANQDALTSTTGPAPLAAFVTDVSVPSETGTVYNDFFGLVGYKAGTAVPYGARLKAAAGGLVTLLVQGTDSQGGDIGWCAQPGGVGTGGGMNLARILV